MVSKNFRQALGRPVEQLLEFRFALAVAQNPRPRSAHLLRLLEASLLSFFQTHVVGNKGTCRFYYIAAAAGPQRRPARTGRGDRRRRGLRHRPGQRRQVGRVGGRPDRPHASPVTSRHPALLCRGSGSGRARLGLWSVGRCLVLAGRYKGRLFAGSSSGTRVVLQPRRPGDGAPPSVSCARVARAADGVCSFS